MAIAPRGRTARGRFTGGSGVKWYYDTLTPSLIALGPALVVALKASLTEVAEEMETTMQSEAPWSDQTGDARQGLRAQQFGTGTTQGIDVFHSVSYGIWLEVRWDGKFAIITPTIERFSMGDAVGGLLAKAVMLV